MILVVKAVLLLFSAVFVCTGLLMVFLPTRFPTLYAGFLRRRVMEREKTASGRRAAVRLQGLMYLTCGAFFALFIWALWDFR